MVTAFRLARLSNLRKSGTLGLMEREIIELIRKEKRLYTIVKGKDGDEKIVEVAGMDGEMIKAVNND
jgi:hypothetical protein